VDFSEETVSILETLFDGVYRLDLDRRIIFWNEAAARITGYSAKQAGRNGIVSDVE